MSYNDDCPLCLDDLIDPELLPCGHSYCHNCLEMLIKNLYDSKAISCPLCKKEIRSTERRFVLLQNEDDQKIEILVQNIINAIVFIGILFMICYDFIISPIIQKILTIVILIIIINS